VSVLPFTAPEDPYLSVVNSLARKLADQQRTLRALDAYYEGRQPLAFIAPEVRKQIGDRLPPVAVNWPRVIVDSVQRRSSVEGFRVGAGGEADEDLWNIWQANDLDEWAALGQLDSLVHGRAALLVWADSGRPKITVESAHQVSFVYRPDTQDVRAGLKTWDDGDARRAVLYLADQVRWYEASLDAVDGATLSALDVSWSLVEVLPNPLGAVPLVPLVNRPRLLNRDGESELTDVVPLADAVNKLATDLMVVSENFAGPRRWATGLEIPNAAAQRERLQAEAAAFWDGAAKGKTWLAGPGAQFGQFPEAQLSNFVEAIGMFTAQIAAIAGLPPHYLGINTENPASADAIRSAEATLVERAREKHRIWGNAYEQAMRLAVAAREGVRVDALPPELASMETAWRDPQTPTVAQSADAAVKLHAEGIIDDVQAQEDVGLSAAQIAAIRARREEAAASAATADVQARLALADRLVADKGLTYNAALAAVGLLAAAAANATPAPPA
jgi:hypothetical protein